MIRKFCIILSGRHIIATQSSRMGRNGQTQELKSRFRILSTKNSYATDYI